MLEDHRVIAAAHKVIVGLGLLEVPIQPHAGVGEHHGLRLDAVVLAELDEPGGDVVDEGVAVADEEDLHSGRSFLYDSTRVSQKHTPARHGYSITVCNYSSTAALT